LSRTVFCNGYSGLMATPSQSARARVRSELTAEIRSAASAALAQDGAAALSLRGVARQVGMAPSALYRYFAGRDELLTELIIDAYNSLADDMERASTASDEPSARWRSVAWAMRRWAFERPHEWALLYGSPVPGYHAPERTVPAAGRVPRVLIGVVETALAAGGLGEGSDPPVSAAAQLAVEPMLAELPTSLSSRAAIGVLAGWEQLSGAISLELFGHFAGALGDPEAVYDYIVGATAVRIGLSPAVR
jgi:AcrR family transcriptional regulator